MASTSKLFGDEKYADSLIQCDNKLLFCHKAIVCTRSGVLAREFDDVAQACPNEAIGLSTVMILFQGNGGKPIEITLFDYHTLYRMLQWIYEGSYEVDAATLESETVKEGNKDTAGDGEGMANGHTRRSASQGCLPHKPPSKIPVTNVMTAHALVYAAAEHYQLPDLKKLALKKFKEVQEDLSIPGLFNLAKAVSRHTTTVDDPLWKAIVKILLANYSEQLNGEEFVDAFVADTDLHGFAVAVISALCQRSVEKSGKDKAATEAQASASKQLLSTLDQTNDALAKSSQHIKTLESELAATKSTVKQLEAQAASCVIALEKGASTISGLQSDLEKANAARNQTESRYKVVETANKQLEKDVKDANDLIKKHSSRADTTQAQLDNVHATIQDKALNAAKYYDLYKTSEAALQKSQSALKSSDAALQKEKKKSATVRDKDRMIGERDRTIEVEAARAEKGKSIIKSIQNVVNSTVDCRQCGADLYFSLKLDDRVAQQPRTEPRLLMLRCSCGTKKYGALVE